MARTQKRRVDAGSLTVPRHRAVRRHGAVMMEYMLLGVLIASAVAVAICVFVRPILRGALHRQSPPVAAEPAKRALPP